MFKYLKYSLGLITILLAILSAYIGGNALWYFFFGLSFTVIVGDLALGYDSNVPVYKYPFFLNLMMYLSLPLLIILIGVMCYKIDSQNIISFIGYFITIGFILGAFAVNIGHELTHRKNSKLDMFIGNWLQALCWDNAFAIEHVYGHHKNVGLFKDAATARRGENIYRFMIRSTIIEHKNAFEIEKKRLEKRKQSTFSFKNRYFIGFFRSIFITLVVYYCAGGIALSCYLLSAFISKILLESINYIEHYGLVRVEGRPIRPRHSWNSNTFISGALLFNLTRHSAHHEKTNLPFWELEPYSEAPNMPYGYLSTFFIALLFPWLYRKIMGDKLEDWDANYASDTERQLVSQL